MHDEHNTKEGKDNDKTREEIWQWCIWGNAHGLVVKHILTQSTATYSIGQGTGIIILLNVSPRLKHWHKQAVHECAQAYAHRQLNIQQVLLRTHQRIVCIDVSIMRWWSLSIDRSIATKHSQQMKVNDCFLFFSFAALLVEEESMNTIPSRCTEVTSSLNLIGHWLLGACWKKVRMQTCTLKVRKLCFLKVCECLYSDYLQNIDEVQFEEEHERLIWDIKTMSVVWAWRTD